MGEPMKPNEFMRLQAERISDLLAENERLRAELDQDALVKFIAEKGLLLEYLLRTRETRLKNYPGPLDPPKS
jgi:hypothetical protein